MHPNHSDRPLTSGAQRREFIANALRLAGSAALLGVPALSMAGQTDRAVAAYTVQDVIDLIIKEVPGAPYPNSVDTLKSGSPSQPVTGIISTMFATVDIIRQAINLKANFIIAHEPTFYNHTDDTDWVKNSAVVKDKVDLLAKNQIAVWRFHDYWHAHNPDGIRQGFLKANGWLEKYQPGKAVIDLPPMRLDALISHLKSSLQIERLRFIGDPAQLCQKIALLPGAAGGQSQMKLTESEKPDVLVVGEVHEWETAEYVRDARALGRKLSLVVLGHAVSEEAGMNWLVDWLQPKIPSIKITHIASQNPFSFA